MSNISENLFQAIDILMSSKMHDMKYDKTVLCKIENSPNKEKGEYIVTDGASKFVAYSENTSYQEGTSVYVTIPCGDYNQRKLIAGKYVEDNGEYFTYRAPFEDYLDITENLIEADVSVSTLLANGPTKEIVLWSRNFEQERIDSGEEDYVGIGKGYQTLGLKAKFRSWLGALNPVSGSYGLRIDVVSRETATSKTESTEKYYSFYLTTDDMFGNVYNFETYYSQEKIFDISMIEEVARIQLVFYQQQDFKDKNDNFIPTTKDNVAIPDNLFVKEPFVSFGYNLSSFEEDTILLYSFDSLTYAPQASPEQNTKRLLARWIHFEEDGRITAIDKPEEIPAEAKLHWYKFNLTEGVTDDLAGNFWQEVNDDGVNKNLLYTFNPDITAATQSFKTIIEFPTLSSVQTEISNKTFALYKKYGCEDPTEENIEAWRKTADSDKLAELDKQLTELTTTLLASVKYYESEIFTFQNEVHVPDQATLELVQGLKIVVDAVGLKGNYCIYGQSNEILNTSEAHKIRTMEARYESLITNDKRLDKASTIRWKIPAHGTMIFPPENGKEYIPMPDEYIVNGEVVIPDDDKDKLLYANREGYIDGTKYTFIDENGKLIPIEGYYIIERNGTEEYPEDADGDGVQDTVEQISVMQDFRIESYYTPQNTNNTVHCEILKNGLTYKASSTLVFGPQGTNGTDSTLVLKFKDDQSAIDKNGKITVEAHLYDYNNTEVQIKQGSLTWQWWKNTDGFEAKDSVLKIGSTTWIEKTIVSTEVDAAGNELSTEQKIKYPEVEIQWNSDKSVAMHNILQCNVKYGNATIGAQALDGVDLENNEALEEEVVTREVNLQAFIPIPFRDNPSLTWAEVPTRIVYDDQGKNPAYYKNAFAITTSGSVEGCVSKAEIIFDDKPGNYVYYPGIRHRDGDSSAPGWFLEPKNMFFNGLTNKVTLKVTVAFNNNGQTTCYNWYQPILIIQNRWPSAMMNAWDGSLTIDEKNGTILSTMMGAGKKEEDNTFSGVLMGDIATGAGYDEKQLGVYGFNHGQQSFGFKDDGTAFIGKAGKGRIEFDGNSGTIQSMSRSQNEEAGMLIDLDDGFIDIMGVDQTGGVTGDNSDTTNPVYKESGAHVRIDVKDPYLSITTAAVDGHENKPSEIMHVGVGKYFLQSADYSATKTKGTHLNINKGQYIAYDPKGNGDYVKISSDGNPFMEVYNEDKDVSLLKVGDRAFFLQSPDFPQTISAAKKGMKVDIINSTITAYDKDGDGDYIKITGQGSPFLQVYDKNDGSNTGTSIIYCGEGSFYMQSSNYSDTNGGLKIDFKQGRMEGGTKSGGNKRWKIENDGKATFAHITATTGGKIGPFDINSTALYTGDSSLGGSGIYLGTSGFSVSSGRFQVNASGVLQAKGGKIGPFTFDEDSFYTGSDSYGSDGIYMSSKKGAMSLGTSLKYNGTTLTLDSADITNATIKDATITGKLNGHTIAFKDVKVLQDIEINVVYREGGNNFITDIGYGKGDTGVFNIVTGISYKQTYIGFRRLAVKKTFFTYKSLISTAEDAVSTSTLPESEDLCYVSYDPEWKKAKEIEDEERKE